MEEKLKKELENRTREMIDFLGEEDTKNFIKILKKISKYLKDKKEEN